MNYDGLAYECLLIGDVILWRIWSCRFGTCYYFNYDIAGLKQDDLNNNGFNNNVETRMVWTRMLNPDGLDNNVGTRMIW